MKEIFLVIVGGGCGSAVRYLVSCLLSSASVTFPYPTLIVNVLGCFLIGFLSQLFSFQSEQSTSFKLLLVTGFLGGFTTFSSFAFEVVELMKDERTFTAAGYVILSTTISIFSVLLGMKIAPNF